MNKKRNVTKALFAVILSLIFCLTLLPVNIVRAENESITVYVSISNGGAFETSKDGETMRYVPVKLTGKESYTISDAFIKAHDDYYTGGASEGYADTSAGWLTKLWGDTSGAFGYMRNNVSAMSSGDAISNGDHIYGYIYVDSAAYSDKYTYFAKNTMSVEAGEEIEFQLTGTGYDSTFNTVTGVCSNAQIFVDGTRKEGVLTDSDGKVKLSFDTPGTYIVTAEETGEISGEESFIVPAFCIVTVSAKVIPTVEPTTEPTTAPTTAPTVSPVPSAAPEVTPAFPVLDKSVSETVDWGIDSCGSYMQSVYGDNIGYGYEWYVFNMLRAGKNLTKETLDKYYEDVVKEVSKWDSMQKPTDIARTVLALSAMGKDITDVGGKNLADMLYNHPDLNTGSNELAYALLALDARNVTVPDGAKWSRDSIINALIGYQNSEGGFGLFDNNTAGIDMTAIILQALAPYYSSNDSVKTAVNAGLDYLRSKMSTNYDFDNNSNSTAVVLMALNALNIDPAVEANGFGTADNNIVTALYGYRAEDGRGYRYMLDEGVNSYATMQVMQALTGYRMMKNNQGSYWIISDKADIIDNNVNTGDNIPVEALGIILIISSAALLCFERKLKKAN